MFELEVWQAPITDNQGNILPGAQITVFNPDDTVATIYDDLDRTPRSNPFTVGTDALARFYAEPGRYRVQAQSGTDIAVYENVDLSQKALRGDLAAQDSEVIIAGRLAKDVASLRGDLAQPDSEALISGIQAKEFARLNELPIAGTFETGFTITDKGQFAIFKGAEADGSYIFRWDGALPKEVPANSSPDTTGGVDVGAWVDVGQAALRSDLAEQFGSARIGNNLVTLSSIKELADIPAEQLRTDLQYSVASFWPGLNLGGGTHVWNPDRPKSDHNGGTVIDPDKLSELGLPSDVDPFGAYFTANASGSGCFEYVTFDNKASLSIFGAAGYASMPQSQCFKAAFFVHNKYGYKITGRKEDTYFIDSDIVTKNIDFDGQGCLIKLSSQVSKGIRSSLGWVSHSEVAPDNNLILQTSLSSDFTRGGQTANRVELSSTQGVEKGQLISIVSNDVLGAALPFVYKRGITSVVQKVDSNSVYLEHTIPFNLTASGSRVVICTPNKVYFKNARFLGSSVEDDQDGLIIDGAVSPVLENLNLDVFGSTSVTVRHCVDVIAHNITTGRSWWDRPTLTNYGLKVTSCNGVDVTGLITFTGRHGFSTGGLPFGLPVNTETDNRGCPEMGIRITKSKIYPELGTAPIGGGNHNGLDTHGSTVDITIRDSEIYRFQIDCDRAVFENCHIKGQANTSSFIGMRALSNGYTSVIFDKCKFDSQRVALLGANSSYEGPLNLTNLIFRDSGLVSELELKLEAEVRNMTPNSTIVNLTVDNFERVRISAHDAANLKVENLNFINLKGVDRQHYNAPRVFGAVGHLYYSNCTLNPTFTAVNAGMAESVYLDNITWGPNLNSIFRMVFSNASEIFIVNTKMDYGTTSTNSVVISDDGGGGTWYSINSPVLISGGASLGSFSFASVTEI